jgi:hypothetical protein
VGSEPPSPDASATGVIVTLARLIIEIRRRASATPDIPRPMALEQAAREVLESTPRDVPRRILDALLGIGEDDDFDATVLDALTPEAIMRLDMLAGAIIDHGLQLEAVQAIRESIIKRVH